MAVRRLLALGSATVLALATAGPVVAVDSLNEYAYGEKRETAAIYDGVSGSANIRTDPPTDPDVVYAHPIWADVGAVGGDFASIGTSNGAESSGPEGTCPAQLNAKWDLYVDWIRLGVYGCTTILANAYSAGSIQPFKIAWSFCNSSQAYRWVLSWDGVQRWCWTNNSSTAAQSMQVGLEVVSSPPDQTARNIDVKYNVLQFNLINQTTWYNWGTLPASQLYADDPYSATNPSVTTVNAFWAPLN